MASPLQSQTRRSLLMGALGASILAVGETATKAFALPATALKSGSPNVEGRVASSAGSTAPINFIGSDHDKFEPFLDQHFRGIKDWEIYTQIKPMLCILENNSGLDAKAYSIKWGQSVSDSVVQPQAGYSHFVQKHYMPKQVAYVCRSGSLRLLSPTFNLDPSEFADQKVRIFSMPLKFFPVASGTRAVGLDAAILSDSSVQGDDRSKLAAHYVSARHAEHDAGLFVLAQIHKSSAPSDITSLLERHIKNGLSVRPKDGKSHYVHARGLEAHDLLTLYRKSGLEGLHARAKTMVRYPRETIAIAKSNT